MAVNIGPKIGIDGEAQYRKQLSQIVQTQKTLKSEMEATASAFDENTSAQEKAEKTSENLEKQIEQQRKKLELQNKMLQESSKKYGDADQKTQKWQQAVNESTRDLNKMEKELKDTNSGMGEVEGSTGEAAAAMEAAGGTAGVFGQVLKANLATEAITKGLGLLKDAVVGVGQAMKDTMVDATAYADDILTLSVETGVSTDTLQEFKYMEDLVDTSLDTMTGSMAKLTKNMASAKSGSKSAVAAFDALHVEFKDGNDQLRDNETVFWETIDALGKMQNETERDALAMQIFGKSAQDLNPLIAAGSDRLAELAEEAHNAGYVLSEEQLGTLGSTQDAFDRWNKTVEGAKNQLATAFAPAVETVTTKLVDMTQKVDWSKASERIGDFTDKFVDFFDEIDWDQAFDNIMAGADGIGDALENIDWAEVGEGVKGVANGVIDFGTWIVEHGDGIATAFGVVGDAIGLVWSLTPFGIMSHMDEFKEAAEFVADGVKQDWDRLKTSAGELKASASEKWSQMKTDFKSAWDTMKSDATSKMDDIKQKVVDKFDAIKEKVDKVKEKLKKAFDFKWSLPSIKLPHFSVSGGSPPWGFMGQGSLPSVSVKWYRQAYDQPMLLSDPTIFGWSGGSLLGGGDGPGDEVVAGAEKLMTMIRQAAGSSVDYSEMKEAVREGMESATVTIRIGERSAKRTLRDLGVEVVV